MMDDITVSNADRTRRFKTVLRKAFPGCKFSVDRGGERISWDEAGPTKTEVEQAILAAGVAEAKVAWNGERRLCVDGGQSVWLDRHDASVRAAEAVAAQRRHEEWREQQHLEAKARAEREAEECRERALFWGKARIAPISLLAELANYIIAQNEKRLPKWKFRLAANLAVQVHPQLTRKYARLFKCAAVETVGVSAKHFLEPDSLRGQVHHRMAFGLFANAADDSTWVLAPKSAHLDKSHSWADRIAFRSRVIAGLSAEHFAALSPDLMLANYCLICGKALIDPVSRARRIGPECWGGASNNLPHVFKAEAAQ
jgi:Family of unknown function (DUF6011)